MVISRKFNPLPHMLYLEHCIISINNSNFQIFSRKIIFYISIVLKILWKMKHLLHFFIIFFQRLPKALVCSKVLGKVGT